MPGRLIGQRAEIGHHLRSAGVRHIGVGDARRLRRHGGKDLVEIVAAGRADRDLAGILFHVLDEGVEVLIRSARRHQQHQRLRRDPGDVRELRVFQRDLFLHHDGKRRTSPHAERVAIRIGGSDATQAICASGAGNILDDEIEALVLQDLLKPAGQDVIGAARIPRDDEGDFSLREA